MVNTGKPSGACGVCRERRIKCDETKPTCLKCIRSGRTCSGYSHGLKLRDQTQKTILRAKLGKSATARNKREPAAGSSAQEDNNKILSPPKTPREPIQLNRGTTWTEGYASPPRKPTRPRSLSLPTQDPWGEAQVLVVASAARKGHKRSASGQDVSQQQQRWSFEWQLAEDEAADPQLWPTIDTPIVEQARCYFLSSYVVYSPRSAAEGMFTFIPSLLNSDHPGKQHFEDMFSAVSIAAFSSRPNAGRAAIAANMYYARGVSRLRKALGDKTHAKSDTALASTILLAVYEGIMSDGVGIVTFNPHFKGAVALLRNRGHDQFSSTIGNEMFDFVMQCLMRQYTHSVTCTDEDILRWSVQAGMQRETDRPHLTAMYAGNLRLKATRLSEKTRDAATIQEAMEILGAAQKFMHAVTQSVEEENTASSEESAAAAMSPLSGSANSPPPQAQSAPLMYPDWWTATRCINKFAFRLFMCRIVAEVAEWLDGSSTGANIYGSSMQFQGSAGMEAAALAQSDIERIMASIPYLCSWTKGQARGASSPCGKNDIESTQGITSLLVIWPLYLAAESCFATTAQRQYIQMNLKLLADNMGVRHASAVSKYLDMQVDISGGSPPAWPTQYAVEEGVSNSMGGYISPTASVIVQ